MSSIAGSLQCMMVAVNGQREIGMTEKKKIRTSKNDAQIACSHPSRCIVIMDDTEMHAQVAQRLVVRNRELTQKGAHRCDRKSARFLRQLDKARERFVRNEGVW